MKDGRELEVDFKVCIEEVSIVDKYGFRIWNESGKVVENGGKVC